MTAKWLLESFRKGCLLPEEQYISASYQTVDTLVLEQPVKPVLSKKNSLSVKEATNIGQAQKADEDLLSQYVANDFTTGKKSIHTIPSPLLDVFAFLFQYPLFVLSPFSSTACSPSCPRCEVFPNHLFFQSMPACSVSTFSSFEHYRLSFPDNCVRLFTAN